MQCNLASLPIAPAAALRAPLRLTREAPAQFSAHGY